MGTSASVSLSPPDGGGSHFGSAAIGAGDLNGDGYADVVVGAWAAMSSRGRAYVFNGTAGGVAATPTVSLTSPGPVSGAFGYTAAGAGDVNGDGYGDLIVGAPRESTDAGSAYLYLGGSGGVGAPATTAFAAPDGANSSFAVALAAAGDVNGDGFGDIAVGALGAMMNRGRAYVFLGRTGGPLSTSTTVLTGPDNNGYFGVSVAASRVSPRDRGRRRATGPTDPG